MTSKTLAKSDPAAVYQSLKERLKPRAYANLDNVNEVCARIHNARGDPAKKDYSISAIARRLLEQGKGPSYNTLNAPGGSHFKVLIRAWAEVDGAGMVRRPAERTPGRDDELLSKIDNENVRGEVAFRLAEARRLVAVNNLLKSKANIIVDQRLKDGTALAQGKGDEPQLMEAEPILNPVERQSLLRAFKPERLKLHGMTIEEDGAVMQRGRVVFETGFESGFAKLLTLVNRHG